MELVPLETLGPSAEQLLARQLELEAVPTDLRLRSFYDGGAQRGVLAVVAVVGLVGFFQPWVTILRPDAAQLSGFELAAGRVGWLWAGACAWLVLLALVLTRRTLRAMRGVRVIAALLASLTAWEIAFLVVSAQSGTGLVTTELRFELWLWLSAAASLVGVVSGMIFGREWAGKAPPPDEASLATPAPRLKQPGEWLH